MKSARKPARTPWPRQAILAVLAAACGLSACGDGAGGSGMAKGGAFDYEPAADGGAAGPAGEYGDQGAGGTALPDENETEGLAFSAPAVGLDHVWVVSPENDLLLRIDAETRKVSAIPVGDAPSAVVTLPGLERGLVLNRGSDELSLVDIGEDGAADVRFIGLSRHFNALALDPSGRFAVLWFDLSRAAAGEDATALQDAALVDLSDFAAPVVTALATGFRPRAPFFSADGRVCYLVTEDGLTVVDLAGAAQGGEPVGPPRLLPTAGDPFHQDGREVAISPDGRYVVSRGAGETTIAILTPADGALRMVELGSEPTDLDLYAEGTRALVMLRSAQQAAFVNLETGLVDRVPLTAPLGSAAIADAGGRAILYTTLPTENLEPRIALLDLRPNPPVMVERPVRKEIAGAAIDPEGRTAFLLHRATPVAAADANTPDGLVARSEGFSLVDLDTAFVRLVTTAAAPRGVLFSESLRRAWIPIADARFDERALMVADLAALSVRQIELPSRPEAVGEVPAADRIFVTQTHPEGRISFLARDAERPEDDELRTLSGYLLNGRIE